MEHTSISPEEAADRLAIRELIDAYAHCADRREAEEQEGPLQDNSSVKRAFCPSPPRADGRRSGVCVDQLTDREPVGGLLG